MTKIFAEGVMQTTAEKFRKWENVWRQKILDKVATEKKSWIFSAENFVMRYMSYRSYLAGDTTLEAKRMIRPMQNNEQLLQGRSYTSSKAFSSTWILCIQALHNTVLGEERLVLYKGEYEFYVYTWT